MDDFLFRGPLADIDPDVAALIDLEAVRQARRLIMIPSESTVPQAIRDVVGSVFHNIYAEGYPPSDWRWLSEGEILDIDARLAELRRLGGSRYYQGTELADIVESLARRRVAERFANERASVNDLYVNVQPLSGAPANSAVYTALIEPGDTILGMQLTVGGHLTHGSPVSRSGLHFNAIGYPVDPDTERLNYDTIRQLALEHQPKIIIGGYTSYPWSPDWESLREIADEVGAYLLADVSHVAGLIMAGIFPSPIGIADVCSFTTHKTVNGPRGAVLITHKAPLARKLDRGVFPGEQGGPHMNSIAALAVAMKIAGTEQFIELQKQTVKNAVRLGEKLGERGLRIPYGGTDTHMLLVDVGSIKGQDATPLSGDMVARILEVAGIVCNRNTIPGDTSPFRATGIRLGTPWVTQRGFREAEMDAVGDAIADLIFAMTPFSYQNGFTRSNWRAKVDFDVLIDVQQRVAELATQAGIDYKVPNLDKHYVMSDAAAEHFRVVPDDEPAENWHTIEIDGAEAETFLNQVVTIDATDMDFGEWRVGWILSDDGSPLARVVIERLTHVKYLLHVSRNMDVVAQWLISLSDGYTQLDPTDIYAKINGPVSVSPLPDAVAPHRFEGLELPEAVADATDFDKIYFVGCKGEALDVPGGEALASFSWEEPERDELLTTPLYDLHKRMGAKLVPFAGYDMPVWYSSVTEEHHAVRNGAGIFDVTHMGVFDFKGPGAERFLDALTTNDVTRLIPGDAHYSYLLGVDGIPLDDIFIYRLAPDNFMVVVNASNNDKNWAWIQAVLAGRVAISQHRPWITAPGRDKLEARDLRATSSGADRRVDIALQGPTSRDVLFKLEASSEDKAKIKDLKWAQVVQVNFGGHDLIVSRTGYTGERTAYEIFPHPNEAEAVFMKLVEAGATPCGLAARDSLRTEAGLPLYGHELEGSLTMNPADAGFGNFVKLWKPFFVGKEAYIDYETKRDRVTIRFRMDHKGVRPPQPGDPVVDRRGRVIGTVTSCSIDSDGYQTGQALVKTDYMQTGTELLVFSGASRTKDGKPVAELAFGDRTTVPETATVLTRFPKR
ncbi:MAG: glycine cleavage system aminomethyltransferase GcvT [Chloroflexi bacterium]|nr:glycine cleavage system aminomethyltransferase GcvT [Chloroflexota bacterium]